MDHKDPEPIFLELKLVVKTLLIMIFDNIKLVIEKKQMS